MSQREFSSTTQDMLDLYDDLEEQDGRGGPLLLALAIGLIVIFAVLVLYGYRNGSNAEEEKIPWVAAEPKPARAEVGDIEIRRPFSERATSLNGTNLATKPTEPSRVTSTTNVEEKPRQIAINVRLPDNNGVTSPSSSTPGNGNISGTNSISQDPLSSKNAITTAENGTSPSTTNRPQRAAEESPAPLVDSSSARKIQISRNDGITQPIPEPISIVSETRPTNTPPQVVERAQPSPSEVTTTQQASKTPIQTASTEPKIVEPEQAQRQAVPEPAPQQPVAASKAEDGAFAVQLASLKSNQVALKTWNELSRKYPAILGGQNYRVERADLGVKGIYYRLLVQGFNSRQDATTYCGRLKSSGQDCIIKRQ